MASPPDGRIAGAGCARSGLERTGTRRYGVPGTEPERAMPHAGWGEITMTARRITRRTFLNTVAAGAAVGPFVSTPARAQGFTWKRFQGKELFLLLTKHPFIDVLEKNIPEFESLSGMKVKWETLPEIQARQKMTVEMTAASGGIDAFFTSLHVEKKRFWKAGWYHPLNKFLDDKSLTSPD